MLEASALRKGTTFVEDDELFKVLDYSHHKMARGGATIRVKVKNLRSGSTIEKTYNGGERIKDVQLEHREAEYLYNDGNMYYFMDTETYEQPAIGKEHVEDIIPYLKENMTVKISTYGSEPIEIEIPLTVDLEVTYAEPGFAGDTATGATKPVTVSTGLEVNTPLFVNEGDVIRIDTRTGEYVTRV